MDQVQTRNTRWPSPIWLVPLISIVLAGWLLYQEFLSSDQTVVITFEQGSGLKPGVPVKYRGVPVGQIDEIRLSDDLDRVEVHASLNRDARALARENSRFWIVEPEIGVAGARNLDTLVEGKYIAVKPGEGEPETRFQGLSAPPDQQPESGLKLTLVADTLGSLKPGRQVFYRDLAVGTIGDSQLSRDARHVEIEVVIQPRYAKLVRTNSKFWNSSGLDVDFGLFTGADIRASSVENLLRGGVSFATPDQAGPLAGAGQRFELNSEAEDEWTEWAPILGWQ
ncbi:MlaD family protein [Alcanivorax marinus]|uniref:MlaD family protein n=1 Tax=Alloalcanivorax marinus TaxID=1177169 RepID=A0A9Q3UL40_9GAMM|nr:MlaD family protein [Alloalcanivorax marinus]MCC4309216.1 MlaD family protein [Alloalcanivorax marinus]MCU5786768.1 PqiB family protein [Alloalcanivorax marinus]